MTIASATTKSAGIQPNERSAQITPGAIIIAIMNLSVRPPYRSEPGHQRYLRRTQTENGSGRFGCVLRPEWRATASTSLESGVGGGWVMDQVLATFELS